MSALSRPPRAPLLPTGVTLSDLALLFLLVLSPLGAAIFDSRSPRFAFAGGSNFLSATLGSRRLDWSTDVLARLRFTGDPVHSGSIVPGTSRIAPSSSPGLAAFDAARRRLRLLARLGAPVSEP